MLLDIPTTSKMSAPEGLKTLNAFLKRAEELDAAAAWDRSLAKIAYYCRFAAVDMGIKAIGAVPPAQQAAANAFLGDLLGRVEGDKAALGVTADSMQSDLLQVRNFALKVFKSADDSDRAGLGSADTARSMVAVGNLLDVVRMLGTAEPKMSEIAKYAKGRSVEILKAIKEGRPIPAPQGDGGFDVDAELAAIGGGGGAFGAVAAVPAPPSYASAGQQQPSAPSDVGVPSSYAMDVDVVPMATPVQLPSPPSSINAAGGLRQSSSPLGGAAQYPSMPSSSSAAAARDPLLDAMAAAGAAASAAMGSSAASVLPSYGGGGSAKDYSSSSSSNSSSSSSAPGSQHHLPILGAGSASTAPPSMMLHGGSGGGGPPFSHAAASSSSSSSGAGRMSASLGRSGIPAAAMQDAMGEWGDLASNISIGKPCLPSSSRIKIIHVYCSHFYPPPYR